MSAIERLQELPRRTLSRHVGCIMKSPRPSDQPIANDIVEVAQGDKVRWTYAEAIGLVNSLETCKLRLGNWLDEQGANDGS